MGVFNPQSVQCPHCQKAGLRVIKDNGRILGYICSYGCGSVFDPDHFIDFERGIIYYLAKRRNPDYQSKLNSDDVFENLEKSEELDRKGVPFYTKTYKIGSKTFS